MNRLHSVLILSILVISVLYIVPREIPAGHSTNGLLTGEVCIAGPNANSCPINPPLINSTGTIGAPPVKVSVVVNSSEAFGGFDVILNVDHTILNASSVSLTGSVLTGANILVECLGGGLVKGSACSLAAKNNKDTIELAAASSTQTLKPTTGLLFTASYTIQSSFAGNVPIGFQIDSTNCSGSSTVQAGLAAYCVSLSGGSSTVALPETVQGAKFTDVPYFDLQDYNLSTFLHVSSLTVPQRTTDTSLALNVTEVNGFSGLVSLTAGTSPATSTISTTISPSSVKVNSTNPSSPFFTTIGVTIFVGGSTTPANYTLTFNATSVGKPVNSLSINLDVPTPDFTLSPSPSSLIFNVTSSAKSTLTLAGLGNFSGTVSLAASTPPGLNASITPNTVTIVNGAAVLVTVKTNTTITGSYAMNVTGTSGTIKHTTTIFVQAVDFTMHARIPSLTMNVGGTLSDSIDFQPTGPYNTTVSIAKPYVTLVTSSGSFSPSLGLSVTCDKTTVDVIYTGTTKQVTTTHCAVTGVVPGSYIVTIQAISGLLSRSTSIGVQVFGPDYSVVPAKAIFSISQGNSTTINVSLNGRLSFADTVNVAAQPFSNSSAPIAFFSKSLVTLTAASPSVNDMLTITTNSSTPIGFYFLNITTSGALTKIVHSVIVTIVITSTASPHDLEVLTVTPSTLSTTIGNDVTITVVVLNVGKLPESSSVSGLVNEVSIAPLQNFTNLAPGANFTAIFTWKTSGYDAKSYIIGGQVIPAHGQTNLHDAILESAQPVTLTGANTSFFQSSYFEPAIIVGLVVLVGLIAFLFLQARRKGKVPQASN